MNTFKDQNNTDAENLKREVINVSTKNETDTSAFLEVSPKKR